MRRRIRSRSAATLAVGVCLLAACGSDTGTSSETPTTLAPENDAAVTAPVTAPATNAPATDADDEPADAEPRDDEASDELFPDIVGVDVSADGDATYRFDVTVSSPYDTASRYADAWRVSDADGTVLGVRELTHGHPTEQPFTRSLSGVEIPEGIVEVTVEGRDIINGWGGTTMTVELP